MYLRCPQCQQPVEIAEETQPMMVTCPSCGSQLDLMGETETVDAGQPRSIGHFDLLEHVGCGHFGDVWRARDQSLDRTVAIKIPRTRDLDRRTVEIFLREARAAAQVRHPNIVPVYEVGRDEELVYIVSDYIHGVTLAEFLLVERLAPRAAAELCVTVAEALEHAHRSGVVHRDLKPGNIMIDGHRQPHLMDFGLAKRDAGEVTVTVNGKILGTPAYMSPEQARGEAHLADCRSDVYSLGVILYELLAGRRPFQGGSRLLIHQVLHEEPRPPRTFDKAIPRDLETICLKAMSKAPERRYRTAGEFAADIKRYLRGEPILARRAGAIERSWKFLRRNWLAAAGCLALGGVLTALGVLLQERNSLQAAGDALLKTVVVTTTPPATRGALVPIDLKTGLPDRSRRVRFNGPTPTEVRVPPGDYLVVVEAEGFGFHEVYRSVPESESQLRGAHVFQSWNVVDGKIELPPITILRSSEVEKNMALFAGGSFHVGGGDVTAEPAHQRHVEPFWLDVTEVTAGQYQAVRRHLPQEAMRKTKPADDDALSLVSFNNALVFAEMVGKRLPTEFEYEFAATNGGTTTFPWGDDAAKVTPWQYGRVKIAAFDVAHGGSQPVFGLFSNVAEWTDSRLIAYGTESAGPVREHTISPVVRGGPQHVAEGGEHIGNIAINPRGRHSKITTSLEMDLGFRCARSAKPRFLD